MFCLYDVVSTALKAFVPAGLEGRPCVFFVSRPAVLHDGAAKCLFLVVQWIPFERGDDSYSSKVRIASVQRTCMQEELLLCVAQEMRKISTNIKAHVSYLVCAIASRFRVKKVLIYFRPQKRQWDIAAGGLRVWDPVLAT